MAEFMKKAKMKKTFQEVLIDFWILKLRATNSKPLVGKFKRRYLWMAILTYFILLLVWIGSGFTLKIIGLKDPGVSNL